MPVTQVLTMIKKCYLEYLLMQVIARTCYISNYFSVPEVLIAPPSSAFSRNMGKVELMHHRNYPGFKFHVHKKTNKQKKPLNVFG